MYVRGKDGKRKKKAKMNRKKEKTEESEKNRRKLKKAEESEKIGRKRKKTEKNRLKDCRFDHCLIIHIRNISHLRAKVKLFREKIILFR